MPWLAATLLLILVMGLGLAGEASPKDTAKPKPWETKDWTQWTSGDCLFVLNASPWTKLIHSEYGDMSIGLRSILVTVRLRSALRTRQALLRQGQLEKGYDKMNALKRQAFDQAHLHDLEPMDRILVYIENAAFGPPATNGYPAVIIGPNPAR